VTGSFYPAPRPHDQSGEKLAKNLEEFRKLKFNGPFEKLQR
jgi:hypothetical protein